MACAAPAGRTESDGIQELQYKPEELVHECCTTPMQPLANFDLYFRSDGLRGSGVALFSIPHRHHGVLHIFSDRDKLLRPDRIDEALRRFSRPLDELDGALQRRHQWGDGPGESLMLQFEHA